MNSFNVEKNQLNYDEILDGFECLSVDYAKYFEDTPGSINFSVHENKHMHNKMIIDNIAKNLGIEAKSIYLGDELPPIVSFLNHFSSILDVSFNYDILPKLYKYCRDKKTDLTDGFSYCNDLYNLFYCLIKKEYLIKVFTLDDVVKTKYCYDRLNIQRFCYEANYAQAILGILSFASKLLFRMEYEHKAITLTLRLIKKMIAKNISPKEMKDIASYVYYLANGSKYSINLDDEKYLIVNKAIDIFVKEKIINSNPVKYKTFLYMTFHNYPDEAEEIVEEIMVKCCYNELNEMYSYIHDCIKKPNEISKIIELEEKLGFKLEVDKLKQLIDILRKNIIVD